jgi:HEAT repeat protein
MAFTVDPVDPGDPVDASMFNSAQARRIEVTLAGYSGQEPPVRNALNDVDPTVRAAALGALDRLGTLTSADIFEALDDADLRVRRRACELATILPLGGNASHDIDLALLRFLETGDETMAELSAWCLGERHEQSLDGSEEASNRSDAHLAEIVKTLAGTVHHHRDALVREAAVAALGCIGTPEAKAPVLHAIGDKATVRRRAVIALAAFEGDDVEAALNHAATDRDWQVRQAAEDLLH